jgi:hypothetical protein
MLGVHFSFEAGDTVVEPRDALVHACKLLVHLRESLIHLGEVLPTCSKPRTVVRARASIISARPSFETAFFFECFSFGLGISLQHKAEAESVKLGLEEAECLKVALSIIRKHASPIGRTARKRGVRDRGLVTSIADRRRSPVTFFRFPHKYLPTRV